MKKLHSLFLLATIFLSLTLSAQKEEAEQLLLNVEKLTQLKQILSDLKKGYRILSTGYNIIKNISQRNFNLHRAFLDGLMEVSPAVKKYRRIADIITFQLRLVETYKGAYSRFEKDGNFNQNELQYLSKVYSNLFRESVKNLDMLVTILTAKKLRMSDDDRLKAIDDVFASMRDKLTFLRQFNNNTTILSIQRAREKKDINILQNIYGITN